MAAIQPSEPHYTHFSPGERIQAQPWAFVGLALATGLALGLAWRFKPARKALKFYLLARRFV